MLSRFVFDFLAAITLAATAVLGAYLPVLLARQDRLKGGTGRSFTFVIGNMFSAGVMVSAGFCHLLGEAIRQMPHHTKPFPLAPFLCGCGYLLTLCADSAATLLSSGASVPDHGELGVLELAIAGAGGSALSSSGDLAERGGSGGGANVGTSATVGGGGVGLRPAVRDSKDKDGTGRIEENMPLLLGTSSGGGANSGKVSLSRSDGNAVAKMELRRPSSATGNGSIGGSGVLGGGGSGSFADDVAEASRASGISLSVGGASALAPLTSRGGSMAGGLGAAGQQHAHRSTNQSHHQHHHHLHHHHAHANGPSGGGSGSGNGHGRVSFLTAVLMGVALCFHSLLEGAAMGAQQTISNSLHIFIAIVSHKGLAAYALGSSIVESNVGMKRFWGVILPFTLASPAGILVGFILSDVARGSGAAAISALASGTFLYVAFMEVIPREISDPRHSGAKMLALLLGYGLMSLLAIWA